MHRSMVPGLSHEFMLNRIKTRNIKSFTIKLRLYNCICSQTMEWEKGGQSQTQNIHTLFTTTKLNAIAAYSGLHCMANEWTQIFWRWRNGRECKKQMKKKMAAPRGWLLIVVRSVTTIFNADKTTGNCWMNESRWCEACSSTDSFLSIARDNLAEVSPRYTKMHNKTMSPKTLSR